MHWQQREVFEMLRDLSGQNKIFVVPRLLVRLCGGWEEAAMLSQILYWSNPDKRDGWFYKTRFDWAQELELTEKQVRRCRTNLEFLELIETKTMRVANSPATWYRPKPEAIIALVHKHRPEWADDRPWGGAAPALGGQSSISQKNNTSARACVRARARELEESALTDEERAEMDRLWNEAQSTPLGQMLLGFMRGGGK
jgi:hypothetical protein